MKELIVVSGNELIAAMKLREIGEAKEMGRPATEIDRLAIWIVQNRPEAIADGDSAVDVAIRIMETTPAF